MQRPGGLPRPSLRPHPTIVTMRNVPSSAGWDRPSDIGVPRNGPATRVVPLVVLLVAAFIAAGAFAGWSLVAGESFEPCRVAAAGLEVRHSMQVEYDQLPRGSIGDRYGSSSGCVPGDDGVGN